MTKYTFLIILFQLSLAVNQPVFEIEIFFNYEKNA
jgi:hypothetical protein